MIFVLCIVSFAVHKLLSLTRFHLLIFVFIFITIGDGSKKILLQFMSESSAHVLSLRLFFFFFSNIYLATPGLFIYLFIFN